MEGEDIKKQKEILLDDKWRTLIVLDACRYDIFEQENKLEGELLKLKSPAINTYRWMKETEDLMEDTIVITAHPWYHHIQTAKEMHPVWKDEKNVNEMGVVEPDIPLDKAIEIRGEREDKLLVHIVQPHLPFIGEKCRDFMMRIVEKCGNFNKGDAFSRELNDELENENLSAEFLRECYIENLRIPLEEIEKRKDELGNFRITADHGEHIGEKITRKGVECYRYGHNLDHPAVREVPYFIRGN